MVDRVGKIESFEFVSAGFRYDIAIKYSRFLRWGTGEDLLHRNAEFALIDHGSDTLEVSGKGFVELLRLVYVEVGAVFVPEGIDHPLYHSRFEIVSRNRIETVIIVLENAVRFVEPGEIPYGISGLRDLGLRKRNVGLSKQVPVDRQFGIRGRQYAYAIGNDRKRCQKALRF